MQGKVFIGDVPCHVHEYRVSVKITCRTGPAPLPAGGRGTADLQFPVQVSTPAGTTRSTVKFTYTVSTDAHAGCSVARRGMGLPGDEN